MKKDCQTKRFYTGSIRFIDKAGLILFGLAIGFVLCMLLVEQTALTTEKWRVAMTRWTLWPCLGVLLSSFLLMAASALKWQIMTQAVGDKGTKTFRFFLRHSIWQNWVGQFVPPSLAVVAGRGFTERAGGSRKILAGLWGGLIDQALDFLFLAAMLTGTLFVLLFNARWFCFLVAAMMGSFAVFCILSWAGRRFNDARLLVAATPILALSLARAALTVLRLIVGTVATGSAIAPLHVAAATAPVALLALIPITPGNLGVAEWGWRGILTFMGETADEAAIFALSFRLLTFLSQTILLLLCFKKND